MKTNKTYSKRVRVTKNGKLVVRKPGHNHYNAKESRSTQMNSKRMGSMKMSNKNRARYLAGA